jgi:adenosylcobinamide-phosphate synthase
MFSAYSLELAFAALLIEALFGYPAPVYEAIRHPANWIGALIARLEKMLNRADLPDDARKTAGALALLVTLVASVLAAGFVTDWTPKNGFGFLLLAVVSSSLVAQRSLHDHVAAVAEALEREGLEGGRAKVAMIVGRDVAALDAAGVARAAVESLAENFSDGVVAPALWIAAFGLKGGALYKAANTADSMIGHKNARYLEFGWAAARFDDLINLPASRLAVLWLILAAAFTRGAEWRGAWTAVRRDAPKHRSPNAGWPEAATAGALDLALAGPRRYHGQVVNDPWLGDGRARATVGDIGRALRLYVIACLMQASLVLAVYFAAEMPRF